MTTPQTEVNVQHALRTLLCRQCHHEIITTSYPDIPIEEFRLNTIPSELEIARQQDLLTLETISLTKLDQETDHLQSVLQRLQDNRAVIRKRMDIRRYYMSSVRKLPVEVWFKILHEACYVKEAEEDEEDGPTIPFYPIRLAWNRRNDSRAIPLTLAQTCIQWRNILFGLPGAWICMRISVDNLTPFAITKLETFVERSQGWPLTVRLEGVPYTDDEADARFLHRLLSQTSELTGELNLFSFFDFKTELSFPLLRKLTLNNVSNIDDPFIHPFSRAQILALLGAPSLIHLCINNLNPLVNHSLVVFSGLTHIELLSPPDKKDLVGLSTSCARLRKMRVHIAGFARFFPNDSTQLVFPRLEFLDVELPISNSVQFFRCVMLPSLTTLKLSLFDLRWYSAAEKEGAMMETVKSLVSYLERTACSIRAFELRVPYALKLSHDSQWLSDIFRLCPEMRELGVSMGLAVHGPGMGPVTPFHNLTSLLTLDRDLPGLSKLEKVKIAVEVNGDQREHQQELADRFLCMVESRSGTSLRVAELDVKPCPRGYRGSTKNVTVDMQEITSRVEALVKDGTRCKIKLDVR